jgi:beta-lactamase superfamily II metal-dependent hydrolase
MFKLHAVQARFGDALILEFGTVERRRFVLIDGGPPDTFDNHLEPALQNIVGNGGTLDLAVVSHIDNDHIVGILDLLAALEEDDANERTRRFALEALWHNSFLRALDPEGEITQRLQQLMTMSGAAGIATPLAVDAFYGVREGHKLRVTAKKLKIPVNKGFAEDLIVLETAGQPVALGPLSLKVIGPTRANLTALRKEWLAWLEKTEADVLADPETAAMADKSIPNLSSIVLLAEAEGKRVLLTGDARGDHILDGLKRAKLLDANGRYHVDVLKVQHHGSDRNTTRTFFEAVTADTYVLSADGKYGNPDYDTLKWIVEAANGRPIRLVATNRPPTIDQLLQTHDPGALGYVLDVRPPDQPSIAIVLEA